MTGKKFERTTPEAVGISSKSLERLIDAMKKYVQRAGGRLMRRESDTVSIL